MSYTVCSLSRTLRHCAALTEARHTSKHGSISARSAPATTGAASPRTSHRVLLHIWSQIREYRGRNRVLAAWAEVPRPALVNPRQEDGRGKRAPLPRPAPRGAAAPPQQMPLAPRNRPPPWPRPLLASPAPGPARNGQGEAGVATATGHSRSPAASPLVELMTKPGTGTATGTARPAPHQRQPKQGRQRKAACFCRPCSCL